jgi:predicted RNA-binding Zn ribbon-like protein
MSGPGKSFRTYNRQPEGGVGFLFVGNRLCLDFVNTRVIEHGKPVDHLSDVSCLIWWLREAGMLSPAEAKVALGRHRGAAGAKLLREGLALRGALEQMARRLATGRSVPSSSIATINRNLRERTEFLELARARGGFRTVPRVQPRDTLALLAPVALSAARLLTEDDPSRVRRCGNPACILYFYDTTRSRTRRWCRMQGCGNRLKVAAHRRRHR